MQISSRLAATALLLAVAPSVGCATRSEPRATSRSTPRPGCTRDVDCKGARICTAGACVDPPRPATATPSPAAAPPTEIAVPPIVAVPIAHAGSQFHGDAHHSGRYPGRLSAEAPYERLRYTTQGTVFGGVALAGDVAIFGSHDHGLYAVALPHGAGPAESPAASTDTSAGELRWRRDLGDLVWATPAVADGVVYAGSDDDALYAIDLASGAVRWRYAVGPCKTRRKVGPEGSRCDVDGVAIGADGTIYAAADGLYAIHPDGKLKWKFSPGITHCASNPAVADDGTVYVGCQDDVLYAIGPDGLKRWDVRTGDDVDSSPAIGADGTIYVGSDDRKLWAIAPGGSVRYSVVTGGPVRSSPALGADGTIYVGSYDGQLYAVAPTGAVRWTYRAADRIVSSPIVDADGAIAFGSEDDRLYTLEPDGRLRWSLQLDADVDGTPTLADDGTLLIGADDRALHALTMNHWK